MNQGTFKFAYGAHETAEGRQRGVKMVDKKTKEGELLEEIQELKDNLDRKEYLLQYNE